MHVLFSRNLTYLIVIGCLTLAGCGSRPVLVSKNARTPTGVDLSGFWQLRETPGSTGAMDRPASGERLLPTRRSTRATRRRGNNGTAVQVFLEYGKSLKITQTHYSVFISYDRSVVEEFTFGENRLVEIGPIEAQRVSGWEDSAFVVETLDDSGATLFESWHLEDSGRLLVRDIRISREEKDSFNLQQKFDRQ